MRGAGEPGVGWPAEEPEPEPESEPEPEESVQVDEPETMLAPPAGTVTVVAATVETMVANTVSWMVVETSVVDSVTVRKIMDGSDDCSVTQVVLRSLAVGSRKRVFADVRKRAVAAVERLTCEAKLPPMSTRQCLL